MPVPSVTPWVPIYGLVRTLVVAYQYRATIYFKHFGKLVWWAWGWHLAYLLVILVAVGAYLYERG